MQVLIKEIKKFILENNLQDKLVSLTTHRGTANYGRGLDGAIINQVIGDKIPLDNIVDGKPVSDYLLHGRDILEIQKTSIEIHDTTEDIFKKFESIGPKLLVETLNKIKN